ncbi:MAG TPA: amidotransferase [Bacteroidales bacterium]|nr:MAG: hypothetical protein A2X06_18020 [Bacteroidetes bacterium GWC2_40_22]HBH85784.1 amidotransferase [Bacteroidales bacterium]
MGKEYFLKEFRQERRIIHCFQHVPFEGPGIISDWAIENNHNFTFTKFCEDYSFPSIDEIDLLVIMGGPMSFDDFDTYSWLKVEIEYIKQAIQANKAIIGICLGAQLIVNALGGKALHGHTKEIGWFPVQFNKTELDKLGWDMFPDKMNVFHWHGDTFEIPQGAVHLASSKAYPNQAFLYNTRVLGLQFHFEMDKRAIESIIKNAGDELIPSEFVQTKEEIMKNNHFIKQNNKIMKVILGKIINYSNKS